MGIFFAGNAYAEFQPYLKNELRGGYYNRGFIFLDCPHPPNPLFWESTAKVKNGVLFNYQRLLYDNRGRFAIYLGAGESYYNDFMHRSIFVESIYPELRYWFIRSKIADFYFAYSVAGPSILSRHTVALQHKDGTIGQKNMGGNFIFQDYMGLGVAMGRHKSILLDVRLVHYSNGDLLPLNPGFDVPIVVYLGYSF